MQAIETAINNDIGERNCQFHFIVHEFEGLLFSEPNAFEQIANQEVVEEIKRIRSQCKTPEHINNSVETAPSKRLYALIPRYAKIRNGVLISKTIGIDKIMNECPHFRRWLEELREWGTT